MLDGTLDHVLPVARGEAGLPFLDGGDLLAYVLDVACLGGTVSEVACRALVVLVGHRTASMRR